ncbi:MAG: hypothetical protein A2458_04090 [Candidatus Kerfeldbacteria bacterium RIFOXYC2_FULL_38_9]|uniref:Uncharacterized protein n=1 Tax=Candidatus Kerfeldbacteria bacterium RIFOXYB2_FULL_38_14 TaxID=1798547 RepID=A0A1G2BAV7_9BACT|nr:MAG: hypothetical protein A2319_05655 [Candidatus Kerfeldbacteria bacterium RIFOXYB2_FULL_38_14]OGY89242.1 MAG: hypothetical protein A2458_04090 [Candidatus Kerfeldbacteria bacterium RIFOXYC2_FULL_38_9]
MFKTDSSEISDKKITLGLWVATHKAQLKQVHVLLLAVLAMAMILFFFIELFNWAYHVPQTKRINEALLQSPINFGQNRQPNNIVIEKTYATVHDEQSVDVAVFVKNPNEKWAAEINYEMTIGGKTGVVEHVNLAPAQEKVLTKTAVATTAVSPSVQTNILDISWKLIKDLDALPKVSWEETDQKFNHINTDQIGAPQTTLEFNLSNKSVYGFKNVPVAVLLQDKNGVVVGIGQQTMAQIASLEKKPVIIRWPKEYGESLQTLIYVSPDILSSENIIR